MTDGTVTFAKARTAAGPGVRLFALGALIVGSGLASIGWALWPEEPATRHVNYAVTFPQQAFSAANPYGDLALGRMRSESPVETVAPPEVETAVPPVSAEPQQAAPIPANVPLPPIRPRELRELADAPEAIPLPPPNPFRQSSIARNESPRAVAPARRVANAPVPATSAPQAEQPGFFQRLFSAANQPENQPASKMLAYANPNGGVGGLGNDAVPNRPVPQQTLGSRTAVYDIEARTVYMPNGARLEAHSGLGPLMDDPRHMRVKNRGVTPPNVYDLKLRESLFHGVQALRMTPVDNGAMFGRDGILAHSYLLGPSGESNGCVSFRDYQAFLDAFNRGEVNRLVVVVRGGTSAATIALNTYTGRSRS